MDYKQIALLGKVIFQVWENKTINSLKSIQGIIQTEKGLPKNLPKFMKRITKNI